MGKSKLVIPSREANGNKLLAGCRHPVQSLRHARRRHQRKKRETGVGEGSSESVGERSEGRTKKTHRLCAGVPGRSPKGGPDTTLTPFVSFLATPATASFVERESAHPASTLPALDPALPSRRAERGRNGDRTKGTGERRHSDRAGCGSENCYVPTDRPKRITRAEALSGSSRLPGHAVPSLSSASMCLYFHVTYDACEERNNYSRRKTGPSPELQKRTQLAANF